MIIKVKPLAWNDDKAEFEFGSYEIYQYGPSFAVYLNGDLTTGEPKSKEAAKAAAQADYEERILSALEPAP